MIIGVLFILVFSAVIIPNIVFRMCASALPVHLKTVDRFSDGSAEVIEYLPTPDVRKYIKGYRISRSLKGIYFRGEWNQRAACAVYELTAYGADDCIIDILRIKEKFTNGKYTQEIALPSKTDYVTLRLVCIDDEPVVSVRRAFGFKFVMWLCALCLALAVACDLLLWLVVTFVLCYLDGFTMTLQISAGYWAAILGYTALAVVVVTASIALGWFFVGKREEIYAG